MPGRSSAIDPRRAALSARSAWRSRLVTSAPSARQDRRLVAGPGAELEDAVARLRREQLGHARDDPRLADRLAGVDRQGLVGVGAALPVAGRRTARAGRRPSPPARARRGCRGRGAGPGPSAADRSSAPIAQQSRRPTRATGTASDGLGDGARRDGLALGASRGARARARRSARARDALGLARRRARARRRSGSRDALALGLADGVGDGERTSGGRPARAAGRSAGSRRRPRPSR